MKAMRMIYAMLLAVVYIAATAMSSLSVFVCDHDHLHHGTATQCEGHAECCSCCHTTDAETSIGCGHHHNLLGDNLTEYIASNERGSSRAGDTISLIADYAVVDNVDVDIDPAIIAITAYRVGYESTPPCAALFRHESLRAPPYLA